MGIEALISIVAAMPSPALLVEQDQRILCCNTTGEQLLGRGLAGRHYLTALRHPALIETIEATLKDRTERKTRFQTSVASRETPYDVTVSPVAGNDFAGVLVNFEDVSPLQDVGQMRRDFVANVSHELRTPLTALLGFIETLRGPAKDDPVARDRFLAIMESEASRMNRLVHDLLSLSRVESEERIRPGARLDLVGQVGATVRGLKPIAEEAGIDIILEGTSTPLMVNGDADQLWQVFSNLIENAVKYGGSGGDVYVQIETIDHEPVMRGPAIRISVTDQGQGIDPIHIPRLTERFYRVDSHRSREMGGTGLGLAIVKHIINRHRGRLRIESALGEGSTFSVILPVV